MFINKYIKLNMLLYYFSHWNIYLTLITSDYLKLT